MTEKPKPCPFCGGSAKIMEWPASCYVLCSRRSRCDTLGPSRKTIAAAIKAWNKAPREAK